MNGPAETPVKLETLKAWIVKLLVKKGMFAAEAEIVALRLIESELLGRPAGGLRWLPRLLDAMDVGDIDPRARLVTLTDLPALLVIDGSTGVGQVVITRALELAVKKANAAGSATVVIKNSRPLGDPTACLATATSAGFVAGILTTSKAETDPWPIGPSTAWGWPGDGSPLLTTAASEPFHADVYADVIAAGLGGKKTSSRKKRLFADDAEHVCWVTDVSKCISVEQFQSVTKPATETEAVTALPWIFDVGQWPECAMLSEVVVTEMRELATTARAPAEW